jgi:cytochrome c6
VRRLFAILLLTIVLCATLFDRSALAEKLDGKQIFSVNCSACHLGGNNVILANKTLRKDALEKYGMDSLEAIKTQVKNGKNAMPAFGNRLTEEQVEAVAAYVLEQAEQGW